MMAQTQDQPTFTSARLKLVPLDDEHLPMQLALDSDPQVLRYLRAHPRTPQQIRDNLPVQKQLAIDAPGMGYWVGLFNDEPIGWFFLQPPERPDQGPVEGQAELGYRLLTKFWRRGFGTEGSRLLLRHAFETLRLDRVFAEAMAVNEASKATMVKLGMRFVRAYPMEDVGEGGDNVEGWEEGEWEYAITKEEWSKLASS